MFLIVPVFFAVAAPAGADEIGDMKKQLADLQARIDQMESQQKKVVAEEVNKAVEKNRYPRCRTV